MIIPRLVSGTSLSAGNREPRKRTGGDDLCYDHTQLHGESLIERFEAGITRVMQPSLPRPSVNSSRILGSIRPLRLTADPRNVSSNIVNSFHRMESHLYSLGLNRKFSFPLVSSHANTLILAQRPDYKPNEFPPVLCSHRNLFRRGVGGGGEKEETEESPERALK